jgi:CHRD domain-containing protein
MKSLSLVGLLIFGLVVTGCGGGDTPMAPSPSSSAATFTAALLPANEVPPVTDSEASGSGTATITFNLTRDSAGYITAATMDATVSVTGFPAGTTLTASHIHPGATGTNGGVFVNLGLTPGEISFASGSGSFTKRGVSLTADQANSIIGNPAAFYLNIHTAANSGGVARGQLTRMQ